MQVLSATTSFGIAALKLLFLQSNRAAWVPVCHKIVRVPKEWTIIVSNLCLIFFRLHSVQLELYGEWDWNRIGIGLDLVIGDP